jgi:hypothetical protein
VWVVAHFGRSLARASCWRSRQVLIAGHGGRRTGQMGPAVLVVRLRSWCSARGQPLRSLRWRVARGQRLDRENRIASKAPDIMRVFENV